nr:HAD family hydrolase [Streptomyces mobaraensis]
MSDKAVLFDLDATLTDHRTAFRRWAAAFATDTNVPLLWLLNAEQRWRGQRARFFSEISRTFDLGRSVLQMQADYRERTAELVPHRPEVCEALEALAGDGWRMGVVTNGEAAAQRTKLRTAGLDHYFPKGVVISSELGIRKPDPLLFEIALCDLDMRDRPAVVVGDDLETDIRGAIRAGLTPVWVSAGQSRRPHDPEPAYTAHTVVEAAQWLLAQDPWPSPGARASMAA